MAVNSYTRVDCRFPADTKLNRESHLVKDLGYRDLHYEIELVDFDGYLDSSLNGMVEEFTELFQRPLDEVQGLELEFHYECTDDEYWVFELDVKDGKVTCRESEICMVECPPEKYDVDLSVGL